MHRLSLPAKWRASHAPRLEHGGGGGCCFFRWLMRATLLYVRLSPISASPRSVPSKTLWRRSPPAASRCAEQALSNLLRDSHSHIEDRSALTTMIVYRKSWLGLSLMTRWLGSALPRAIIPALFSTFECMLLEGFVPDAVLTSFFEHPYPFQVFAYIVAFALVFRTNTAHGRYWEMRTHFAQMTSKWSDAAALSLDFEELSIVERQKMTDEDGADARSEAPAAPADKSFSVDARTRQSQALLVHRFSLMHALALQYLRRDNSLERLVGVSGLTPTDVPEAPMETPRRERTESTAILGKPEGLWARIFRLAFADQDNPEQHEAYADSQPLAVLGGLDEQEKCVLDFYADRVYLLFSIILGHLGARRRAGGLAAEPPVYTRVLQVMSDGMLGFQQARKVEDTPFPFPYAQLLAFMLYAFGLLFPVLAASKVGSNVLVEDEADLEGFYLMQVCARPNSLRLRRAFRHRSLSSLLSCALISARSLRLISPLLFARGRSSPLTSQRQ